MRLALPRLVGLTSLVLPIWIGCTSARPEVAAVKRPSTVDWSTRSAFLPPPLDGAKIDAKNVELHLPRGCVPLDGDAFARVVGLINDDESELLSACNVGDGTHLARATVVLIRHRVQIETGESAAASLRRAPGVLRALTTTATVSGATLGAEVVLTTAVPSSAGARPSTSVFFGAQDGLYVLYAEVDSDAESIDAWGEAMTRTLRPTPSAHPIRWRAPTALAPSHTVMGGPYRIRLPEGVSVVPKDDKRLSDVVGGKDPLALHHAGSLAAIRDDAGIAMGGSVYLASLLPPIASTAPALAKMTAEARGAKDVEAKLLSAAIGSVARVDGTKDDGSHEVYGAFRIPGKQNDQVMVVHLVIVKEKWAAYAPFIDASLASIERSLETDSPY